MVVKQGEEIMENRLLGIENRIDVEPIANLSNSSPEQAEKNILESEKIGVPPDDYAKSPDTWKGKERKPMNKNVANRMMQSSEVAKVMDQDLNAFEYIERQYNYAKDLVDQTDLRRELNDAIWDYKNPGSLSQEEQDDNYYKMVDLYDKVNSQNLAEKHDQTFFGGLPAEMAQTFYDQYKGLGERVDVLATTMGGAALLAGGVAGLSTGGAAALPAAGLAAVYSAPFAYKSALAFDQFKQTFTTIYGDGVMGGKFNTAQDESELTAIAAGVAVASGAMEFASIGWIQRRVPWIKKVKAKDILGELAKPSNRKYREFFKRMGKAAGVEGGTEVVQELFQAIGSDAAKNVGEDGNLGDAIGKTLNDLYEGKEGARENLAKSFVLGGAVGAATQAGFEGVGKLGEAVTGSPDNTRIDVGEPTAPSPESVTIESDINFDPNSVTIPEVQAGASMRMGVLINRIAQAMKSTRTNEIMPLEMEAIIEGFSDDSGIEGVYVERDELNEWVGQDETRAELVRGILDGNQMDQSDIDAPILIPIKDAVAMTVQDNKVTQVFKYSPESPSVLAWSKEGDSNAKVDLEADISDLRAELVERVKAEGLDTLEEQFRKNPRNAKVNFEEIKNALDNYSEDSDMTMVDSALVNTLPFADEGLTRLQELKSKSQGDTPTDSEGRLKQFQELHNKDNYNEQKTFTAKNEKLNEPLTKAKQGVVKALKNGTKSLENINKVGEIEAERKRVKELEAKEQQLTNNQNTEILENFINSKGYIDQATGEVIQPDEDGRVFYIDPNSLSDSQKKQFLKNRTLNSRGVFKEGGGDVEELAGFFGQPNGDALLTVLRDADDRRTIRQKQKENFDKQKALEERAAKRVDDLELDKAYDKVTEAHVKEAEAIEKETLVKGAAKQLGHHVAKAQDMVNKIRLRDLNPTQWKIGERIAQQKARRANRKKSTKVDAINHKNNAALNSQLAKQTHKAIANVNRAMQWLAYIDTKRNQNILNNANPMFKKSIDALKAVFKLDQSIELSEENMKAWTDFVDDYYKRTGFNLKLPDNLDTWVEGIDRVEDMTVSQFMYAADLIKLVMNEAKKEGVLYGEILPGLETQDVDIIAEVLQGDAINHPQYDPSRVKSSKALSFTEKMLKKTRVGAAFLDNYQFIILNADQGNANGIWTRAFWNPLVKGLQKKNQYKLEFARKYKIILDELGGKKYFKELQNTVVTVDEFSNIPQLRNGRMTKLELVTILANFGNLQNRQRLTNYGLEDTEILRALEKHLGRKEVKLVQEGIWDNLNDVVGDILELERSSKGQDPELVEATPFFFNGQAVRGGYFPLRYMIEKSLSDKLSTLDRNVNADPNVNQADDGFYDGVIFNPHLEQRVGSDFMVDFDFNNVGMMFDTISHDLGMRLAVRDVNELLQRREITEALVGVVGSEKVDVVLDTLAEQTRKVPDVQIYKEGTRVFDGWINAIERAQYTAVLTGNIKSWSMASLTIPQMLTVKGKDSLPYMRKAFTNLHNKQYRKAMLEFAAKHDPSLAGMAEGMEAFHANVLSELHGKGRLGRLSRNPLVRGVGKILTPFRDLRDYVNEVNFKRVLGGIDSMYKAANFTASYAQFMDGKADGWPLSKLEKMSSEQREQAAISWATNINSQTTMVSDELNKAPIQKMNALTRSFSRFWNEPRNVMLTRFQQYRNIKNNSKKMTEAYKKGDFIKAMRHMDTQVDQALRAVIATAMVNFMIDAIQWQFDDDDNRTTEEFLKEDIDGMAARMKLSYSSVGANMADILQFENMPVLSSLVRGAESGYTDFDTLVTSALSAVSSTYSFTTKALKEMDDGLTLAEIQSVMNEKEFRDFLNTIGIFVGGVPTKGIMDLKKFIEKVSYAPYDMSGVINHYNTSAKSFSERNEGSPIVEEVQQSIIGPSTSEDTSDSFTQEDMEVIKYAESGGKWNAFPIDRKTGKPRSSAFGVYQFTRGTWVDLMNSPEGQEAGLTMKGWTSKDTSQQEKAMQINVSWIKDELYLDQVPINRETVYFGHHFGIGATNKYAAKVFNGDKTDPVPKELVTPDKVKANPWLKGIKTVGQFRTKLNALLNNAERNLESSRR